MLGSFSVSLHVKDIEKSYAFYKKLGFQQMGGFIEQKWVILKNGDAVIGLFQDMFDHDILTFNPGYNQSGQAQSSFIDIREIQKELQRKGLDTGEIISTKEGPAHFTMTDPDGHIILFDQHI